MASRQPRRPLQPWLDCSDRAGSPQSARTRQATAIGCKSVQPTSRRRRGRSPPPLDATLQVSGLDASDGCSEIHALFETTGAITQILTVAPAADGRPAAALVCFADAASADAAVDLFDSYPWAGSFLEVQRTDAGATGRLLAALAEIQGAGPAPPTALTAPAAALAVAFATGAPVSLPAPFAGGAPSAAPTEPPAFGLENPEDWLPPANWQPPSAPAEPNATAWAAKTGGPAAVKQAPAPAQSQPGLPEWETDRRCRIYIQVGCSRCDMSGCCCMWRRCSVALLCGGAALPLPAARRAAGHHCSVLPALLQNLRQGVTAEDLKAYFTK